MEERQLPEATWAIQPSGYIDNQAHLPSPAVETRDKVCRLYHLAVVKNNYESMFFRGASLMAGIWWCPLSRAAALEIKRKPVCSII